MACPRHGRRGAWLKLKRIRSLRDAAASGRKRSAVLTVATCFSSNTHTHTHTQRERERERERERRRRKEKKRSARADDEYGEILMRDVVVVESRTGISRGIAASGIRAFRAETRASTRRGKRGSVASRRSLVSPPGRSIPFLGPCTIAAENRDRDEKRERSN